MYTTPHAIHVEIVLNGFWVGKGKRIFSRAMMGNNRQSKDIYGGKKQLFFCAYELNTRSLNAVFGAKRIQRVVYTPIPQITFIRPVRSVNMWNT